MGGDAADLQKVSAAKAGSGVLIESVVANVRLHSLRPAPAQPPHNEKTPRSTRNHGVLICLLHYSTTALLHFTSCCRHRHPHSQ
jgi:hypothetical protein